MKIRGRRVLICDCEGTTSPDAQLLAEALACDPPVVHRQLCRAEIDRVRAAVVAGEPLMIACLQEAPLFAAVAREANASAPPPAFADIRDRAGWSREGKWAGPKIAALLAEAALPLQPAPAVNLASQGRVLVYGDGEVALAAADRLSRRLSVTALLRQPADAVPPRDRKVAIYRGTLRQASGVLGSFSLVVDGFAAATPSSRAVLRFQQASDGATISSDLLLDLSGGPALFPAPRRRDGYLRAEPSDPVAIERALFELVELVGDFEKPRYLRIDPSICAHQRNGIVGCDLCLSVCPTAALAPAGDHIEVDAKICDGAGACASVCPTGAIVFDLPRGGGVLRRLETLSSAYRSAGGRDFVLLVHDAAWGGECLSLIARNGPGLPANVIPFAVGGETGGIAQIGLDFLLAALTLGATQVRLLAGPEAADEAAPLRQHVQAIQHIFAGLGWMGDRVLLDLAPDPLAFAQDLYSRETPPAVPPSSADLQTGGKRDRQRNALAHLRRHAPVPADVLAMPAGAPFGEIIVDAGRCTLCLACVGACPTGALSDDPGRPLLAFRESDCVQCGLCRRTCPEDAVTLSPRLLLGEAADRRRILQEDTPFPCIRCGKPFASAALIDRLTERMAGHAMFAGAGGTDVLKMCEDCRVGFHFSEARAPMAGGERPLPRTTDDYLRERLSRQTDKDEA